MSTITIAPTLTRSARPARPRPLARGQERSQERSQVRLTRRGRLVLFALALVVVAAVAVWLAAGSAATHEEGSASGIEVVTVTPGDTLWDIASAAAVATGSDDVRDMMDTIQQLNTLDSSVVYVGQDLRVPAAD